MTLRDLPQVDDVVRRTGLAAAVGHTLAVSLAREAIEAARERARRGIEVSADDVTADALARATSLQRLMLRRVVNATGVILHTNLGRAPLAREAVEAMTQAAGATNIEMDLGAGSRGALRAPAAAALLRALTGAGDAHIANNNAAALMLALATLSSGREVIVSRGELIEIGGEFRLPAIMEAAGAILREVGTTNRTRSADISSAINEHTALILKVHPSNYRIIGFTDQPSLSDTVAIAHEAGLPVLYDIGSGLLAPDAIVPDEPDATTALAAGADLVCFSGDKLLGGPQAGILAGKADLIAACRRHPFARAMRADKITLAALEATLSLHARGRRNEIPTWRMIAMPLAEIRARSERVAAAVGGSCVDAESVIGGGSDPGRGIPTVLISIPGETLAERLRASDLPIVARVGDGATLIDLRTVDPSDDDTIISALT